MIEPPLLSGIYFNPYGEKRKKKFPAVTFSAADRLRDEEGMNMENKNQKKNNQKKNQKSQKKTSENDQNE